MGRHKSYDREEVARKAMDLFWRQGFNATSTKALADHMGINAYSLFAEFDSKRGLFEAALALYLDEVVARTFGPLDSADAGMRELVAVVDAIASLAGQPGAERGCLACNTATELAPLDSQSRRVVKGYLERIQAGITNAFENAKLAGELRPEISCKDQGRLLGSSLLGFSVLMRAGVSREVIAGAARAMLTNLERMRA